MWSQSWTVKYQLNTRGSIKRKQRTMVSRVVVSAIGVKMALWDLNGICDLDKTYIKTLTSDSIYHESQTDCCTLLRLKS